MKRILLGALGLVLSLHVAGAAPLTIARAWTVLRAGPAIDAAAVGLAFGNDSLPVLRRTGEWIAVRLPGGRQGWLRAEDAELPAPPPPPELPVSAAPMAPPAEPAAETGARQ